MQPAIRKFSKSNSPISQRNADLCELSFIGTYLQWIDVDKVHEHLLLFQFLAELEDRGKLLELTSREDKTSAYCEGHFVESHTSFPTTFIFWEAFSISL